GADEIDEYSAGADQTKRFYKYIGAFVHSQTPDKGEAYGPGTRQLLYFRKSLDIDSIPDHVHFFDRNAGAHVCPGQVQAGRDERVHTLKLKFEKVLAHANRNFPLCRA